MNYDISRFFPRWNDKFQDNWLKISPEKKVDGMTEKWKFYSIQNEPDLLFNIFLNANCIY